jgi:hypothetical protein
VRRDGEYPPCRLGRVGQGVVLGPFGSRDRRAQHDSRGPASGRTFVGSCRYQCEPEPYRSASIGVEGKTHGPCHVPPSVGTGPRRHLGGPSSSPEETAASRALCQSRPQEFPPRDRQGD